MTQIQLIDLCSRVPYHPKGHVVNACNGAECDEWLTCATFPMFTSITNNSRLYLRPLSSLNGEECISLSRDTSLNVRVSNGEIYFPCIEDNTPSNWNKIFDWLNKNMFDYRGLLECGLAIEVTEGMYNLNEK